MTTLGGLHNYTYDDLYRLEIADHPDSSDENYSYDEVGNRLSSSTAFSSRLRSNNILRATPTKDGESRSTTSTWSYNAGNQILDDGTYTYEYDDNGNMTKRTKKSDSSMTTYTYNSENQLTQITSDSNTFKYAYDGLGRRIQKDVNGTITKYIYDNEDIIAEYSGSSTTPAATYLHGPGIDEPIYMSRGGSTYYYHVDGLGSIAELIDSSGTVVQSYKYDAFGNIISQTGALANPFTYTGREFDSESGLLYYRRRYYDPKIGRFLSRDPLEYVDSPNPYVYTLNNPINYIDPYGLWRLPDYGSFEINVSITTPWTGTLFGWSGQVTVDRYGNVYWAPFGATIGKSATVVSGSLTAGWLNKTCGTPSEGQLGDFLSGSSVNIGGGYWGGGGVTWVPGRGSATNVGLVSPQGGASYHYSWKKGDLW